MDLTAMGSSDDDYHRNSHKKHERNKFHRERNVEVRPPKNDEKDKGVKQATQHKTKYYSAKRPGHGNRDTKECFGQTTVEYDQRGKRDRDPETVAGAGISLVKKLPRTPTRSSSQRSPPLKRTRNEQLCVQVQEKTVKTTQSETTLRSVIISPKQPAIEPRRVYINPQFIQSAPLRRYYHNPKPYHPNTFVDSTPSMRDRRMYTNNDEMQSSEGMLSFRSFLIKQDDFITHEEAKAKYYEYKQVYYQTELETFFTEHRDEEWFQQKYHPSEMLKIQKKKRNDVKIRKDIFMEFLQAGGIDGLRLDLSEQDKLLLFLDKMVILLEGGTMEDFAMLDEPKAIANGQKVASVLPPKDEVFSPPEESKRSQALEVVHLKSKINKEEMSPVKTEQATVDDENKEGEFLCLDTESDCEAYELHGGHLVTPSKTLLQVKADRDEANFSRDMQIKYEDSKPPAAATKPPYPSEDDDSNDTAAERTDWKRISIIPEVVQEDNAVAGKFKHMSLTVGAKSSVILHQLGSLFIRSLPASVPKREVEEICRKFPGFMRLGLADPQAERRWLRRGWVTFENSENLQQICRQMNMLKLRNHNLGVILNRKIIKRVRYVSSLSRHDLAIKFDLSLAAQVIYSLDTKFGLWPDDGASEDPSSNDQPLALQMLKSKNPLMNNLINMVTVNSSTEERELLRGLPSDAKDCQVLDKDSLNMAEVTAFLDRLLLYLRVVHSVDYYKCCEYVNEHQMPVRCGILHVRGVPAKNKVTEVTRSDVVQYCEETEKKVNRTFLRPPLLLSDGEAKELGLKDKDQEIERYILANTTKLGDNKYLCHVSCKKFTAAHFVRKHIISKHADRLDVVRDSVDYFNNYLRDIKRPKPMDPALLARRDSLYRRGAPWGGSDRAYSYPRGFHPSISNPCLYYQAPYIPHYGYHDTYSRQRPSPVFDRYGRQMGPYRDLDAPENPLDMF